MLEHSNSLPAKKKTGINKLILGFAALVATAVIATTGIGMASAAQNDKPTKAQCAAAGFTNYGQCVKEWAHSHHPGGGYGNTANVNVNLHLDLNNSDHNVIQVILNFFM